MPKAERGFEKQLQHFIASESRALRSNLFDFSQPVIPRNEESVFELLKLTDLLHSYFVVFAIAQHDNKNKKYFRCNPVYLRKGCAKENKNLSLQGLSQTM